MLLILEIILTVKAWGKGWGARALLLIGTMLGAGFVVGLAIGAAGGSLAPVVPFMLLGEVGCIGRVLFALALRAPHPGVAPVSEPVACQQSIAA